MLSFSQRYGFKPATQVIQQESLDVKTVNALWNKISEFLQQESHSKTIAILNVGRTLILTEKMLVSFIPNETPHWSLSDLEILAIRDALLHRMR